MWLPVGGVSLGAFVLDNYVNLNIGPKACIRTGPGPFCRVDHLGHRHGRHLRAKALMRDTIEEATTMSAQKKSGFADDKLALYQLLVATISEVTEL
jgi:hypothetical protein